MQACQLVCAAALCQSCITTAIISARKNNKKFPMEITLNDGTKLTGEAKVPDGKTKSLTLREEDGTKHKLKSADIDFVESWNPKSDDTHFTMFYREKRRMVPRAAGENLMILSSSADFTMDKHGTMTVSGQSIVHYAVRRGDGEVTRIGGNGFTTRSARKALLDFLSDDPELCRMLEEKEVGHYDYEKLCELYKPARRTQPTR